MLKLTPAVRSRGLLQMGMEDSESGPLQRTRFLKDTERLLAGFELRVFPAGAVLILKIMKASEMIQQLQKSIDEHGNLEVYQRHYNGCFGKSGTPSIAFRSVSSRQRKWNGLTEADKGEKVFKI